MEFVALAPIIADEDKAEEFLRQRGVLRSFTACPYCDAESFGRVRRQMYKCYSCRKEWSIRKGSVLEKFRMPLTKVVLGLKLFELEMPVLKATKELGLSYKTTHKFFMHLRKAIAEQGEESLLEGEVEADESYFGGKRKGKRGRGAAGKTPVFGILERNGQVRVEVVKDVKGETLLKAMIKKVKRGSLIYTDKWKGYDGLVTFGFRHERIDHSKRFANGKVYINGIEGFWSYAKGRLQKYHGIGKENFGYYLKELEFRYNHRDDDLFDLLVEFLKVDSNT